MSNFNLYSSYYDLLYKDKDYRSESNYVQQVLKQYLPNCKSLLELGCGTGNHAVHLCANGYTVHGIERSEQMVQEGLQKKIEGFNPSQGDITGFKLNKTFDAAVSLFHVISYLTENDALLSCFKAVHEHLNPGGLFLFDVWYSPAVYFQQPETRIKRLQGNGFAATRLAEPVLHTDRNVVDVNYEIIVQQANKESHVFKELHPMRHFSIPEIDLLAKSQGFELIKAEEFLTASKPSTNTWGVCFLLKKIN
jgi:SAM-dependent methyltransferase